MTTVEFWLRRKFYRGFQFSPLTPNDPYRGRTAPLTSKRCILYIYSTNIGTEYFKRGLYSPFFLSSKCSLFHNSSVFGSCIIHILYTGCAKIKKKYSGAKRLICVGGTERYGDDASEHGSVRVNYIEAWMCIAKITDRYYLLTRLAV
jgi:hypothetical protein